MKIVSDVNVPPNEAWFMETLGYRIEPLPAGIRLVVERRIVGKIVNLGSGEQGPPQ